VFTTIALWLLPILSYEARLYLPESSTSANRIICCAGSR
jgi:hypothetical protein